MSSPTQPARTSSQIEADLGATRDRLAASVEALIDQVHPNRIKQRSVARIKQSARDAADRVRAQFFTTRGDLRKDRVGAIAGGLAGLIGFVLIVKAIGRRGRKA